jgi:hypothetical protein
LDSYGVSRNLQSLGKCRRHQNAGSPRQILPGLKTLKRADKKRLKFSALRFSVRHTLAVMIWSGIFRTLPRQYGDKKMT